MTAWTYSYSPGSVTRDAVRLLCGQTSTADDVLLYDSEIDWLLTQYASDQYQTAAAACESMASRYAAQPQREDVGQLGLTWGDRATALRQQAKQLRGMQAQRGVSPYVSGVTRSEQQTDAGDSDIRTRPFSVGRDDNPDAVMTGSSVST